MRSGTLQATALSHARLFAVSALSMHHIYAEQKMAVVVGEARGLKLRGAHLFGKPGRVVVEGPFNAVREYEKRICRLRWQKCAVMCRWVFISCAPSHHKDIENELRADLANQKVQLIPWIGPPRETGERGYGDDAPDVYDSNGTLLHCWVPHAFDIADAKAKTRATRRERANILRDHEVRIPSAEDEGLPATAPFDVYQYYFPLRPIRSTHRSASSLVAVEPPGNDDAYAAYLSEVGLGELVAAIRHQFSGARAA